jgi:glyoxylase-like metal-dependent hydrolase (beta-lactamase superfamily II)
MVRILPLNLGTITRPMSGFGYGFGSSIIDVPLIGGFYVDLKAYYRSLEKMAGLKADLILPGHDFKVFEKEAYF